jgi:hypothetical protein
VIGAVQRLVTMGRAEVFEDVATGALRLRLGCLKRRCRFRRTVQIGGHYRINAPGDGSLRADVARLRRHAIECGGVLAHEIFRPRDAGEIGLKSSFAEAHAALAVLAVEIPTAMLRQAAFCPYHLREPDPQGFLPQSVAVASSTRTVMARPLSVTPLTLRPAAAVARINRAASLCLKLCRPVLICS